MISATSASPDKIKPANVPPNMFDIIPASTVPDIILGISSLGNHFIAKLEGELSTNMFPIAHSTEPVIAHNGSPGCMIVLVQAPAMTKTPPMVHPTRVPNLSKMKLQGIEIKGWIMGLERMFKDTITPLYPNFFYIIVEQLTNVFVGIPFAKDAITKRIKFK
jgi:hypothetical protein